MRRKNHDQGLWDAGPVVSAMGYGFSVPDEDSARALAVAFADFGFPQVSANPEVRGGWRVQVVDEYRYSDGHIGDRQRHAVRRRAMAIAGEHGGFASGLAGYHPGGQTPSLARGAPQILLLNPERHPPVPVIAPVPVPSAGLLSLEPDLGELTPPDFSDLRSVRWESLDHAYSRESLPGLITDLVLGRVGWGEGFPALVVSVIHQGTVYPATAPALRVLGGFAAAGALAAAARRDVCALVLWAAGLLRQEQIDDFDCAVSQDGAPRLELYGEVREAARFVTPQLLARWDAEPSACRLLLAALAAEFPDHGASVTGKIMQMAASCQGTQVHEYLVLARHLIAGDDASAYVTATGITYWNEDFCMGWVDDDSIAPGLRAVQVLADAVGGAACRTRSGS